MAPPDASLLKMADPSFEVFPFTVTNLRFSDPPSRKMPPPWSEVPLVLLLAIVAFSASRLSSR